MTSGPLVGTVSAAHRAVAARLAALEGAAARERADRLADLAATVHATADAEERVLFPAFRRAMDGEGALAEACAAEHRDLDARLDALASNPLGVGFPVSVHVLARDLRHHQLDELYAIVPFVAEALGADEEARLADEFGRALAFPPPPPAP